MNIHARRLTAQLLAGAPARDPLDVAERLLAIQGQDPGAPGWPSGRGPPA